MHGKNDANYPTTTQIKHDLRIDTDHTHSDSLAWMELDELDPSIFCSDFVDHIFTKKGAFYANHAMRKCIDDKGSGLVAPTRCGCRNCETYWVESCEMIK